MVLFDILSHIKQINWIWRKRQCGKERQGRRERRTKEGVDIEMCGYKDIRELSKLSSHRNYNSVHCVIEKSIHFASVLSFHCHCAVTISSKEILSATCANNSWFFCTSQRDDKLVQIKIVFDKKKYFHTSFEINAFLSLRMRLSSLERCFVNHTRKRLKVSLM